MKKSIINRQQPLEMYVDQDKNSSLWKWELDWTEISMVRETGKRWKMEIRRLVGWGGRWYPSDVILKAHYWAPSGTQVTELAESSLHRCLWKVRSVMNSGSHMCTDLSWECSWQYQFTNNAPRGPHKKPGAIGAFWHSPGANNFISVYLKS